MMHYALCMPLIIGWLIVGRLFLEQVVDVLDIVERVIDEELKFRDDTELVSLEVAEFEPDLCCIVVDVVDEFFGAC